MKNTNTLLIALAILVAGFSAGYVIRGDSTPSMGGHQMSNGQSMNNHMMADGNMMADHMMTGNNSMSSMMDGMMANIEGKSGDEFDKAFLSEMIVHHEGAVRMATAALKNSKHPELTQLAKDIISAQEKEIGMMKGWQKTWFNQ